MSPSGMCSKCPNTFQLGPIYVLKISWPESDNQAFSRLAYQGCFRSNHGSDEELINIAEVLGPGPKDETKCWELLLVIFLSESWSLSRPLDEVFHYPWSCVLLTTLQTILFWICRPPYRNTLKGILSHFLPVLHSLFSSERVPEGVREMKRWEWKLSSFWLHQTGSDL